MPRKAPAFTKDERQHRRKTFTQPLTRPARDRGVPEASSAADWRHPAVSKLPPRMTKLGSKNEKACWRSQRVGVARSHPGRIDNLHPGKVPFLGELCFGRSDRSKPGSTLFRIDALLSVQSDIVTISMDRISIPVIGLVRRSYCGLSLFPMFVLARRGAWQIARRFGFHDSYPFRSILPFRNSIGPVGFPTRFEVPANLANRQ